MSLSSKLRNALANALGNKALSKELADTVDIGAVTQAGAVALLGSTSNLSALVPAAASISGSAGTYAIPGDPTGAEVDTAIDQATAKVVTALGLKADNVDAETLRTQTEARLDAIEAKIDAVITALKNASLMA